MKKLITDRDISAAAADGMREVLAPQDALVTTTARQKAAELGIAIRLELPPVGQPASTTTPAAPVTTIAPNVVSTGRRGGGEWGAPLTAEDAAPVAVDMIAARRAALAAQAAPAAAPAAPAPHGNVAQSRRGGGEWGAPLTAQDAAPSGQDMLSARRAAMAAQAAAPQASTSAPTPQPAAPDVVTTGRRGGGEWGAPLTAQDAAPVAVDMIAARRAAMAARSQGGSASSQPVPAATVSSPAPSATTTNGSYANGSVNGAPMTTRSVQRAIPKLADFDRVREMLRKYQLDAVICAVPHNVYYLSGLDTPPMWEFGWYAFAMVPVQGEPALVLSGLGLSAPATADLAIKDYYPFSRGELIVYDATALLESEAAIRSLSQQLRDRTMPNAFEAIGRMIADRGLTGKKIGFDDTRIVSRLPNQNFQAFDAIDMMRDVRMIKTEAEIQLMKEAAVANEQAALEAVRFIPQAKTWDDVIRRYNAAIALRGGKAAYLIGGAPHHTGTHQHMFGDYPLQRGDFLMVDALGSKAHYYGDFGRTVSLGEPNPEALRRFNAMRKGFEAGMAMVKPGVKFEDIAAKVVDTVRKEGFGQYSICAPHSVGLEHTDMPRRAGAVVQPNMTMNLDIAYLEAGFGALHLEDTFVVRSNGVELLTSGKTEMIVLP